jgi:hypothetical protein
VASQTLTEERDRASSIGPGHGHRGLAIRRLLGRGYSAGRVPGQVKPPPPSRVRGPPGCRRITDPVGRPLPSSRGISVSCRPACCYSGPWLATPRARPRHQSCVGRGKVKNATPSLHLRSIANASVAPLITKAVQATFTTRATILAPLTNLRRQGVRLIADYLVGRA